MWCPVCRKGWPDRWSVCGDCLAQLVANPDATVRCRHCGKVCPDRMQSCPNCLAELHVDPAEAAEASAEVLAAGLRLPRPAGVAPFQGGVDCTLFRTNPKSSLLYTGTDELVEAYVQGRDHRAEPPLDCCDVDGTVLFRLLHYRAAAGAVVAVDPDGAPFGTYLRLPGTGHGLDVRDETSAPVARLVPGPSAGDPWELVETGREAVATIQATDVRLGDFVDDEWTVRRVGPIPLKPLAVVALALAAKVLLGRPSPAPVRRTEPAVDAGELGDLGDLGI